MLELEYTSIWAAQLLIIYHATFCSENIDWPPLFNLVYDYTYNLVAEFRDLYTRAFIWPTSWKEDKILLNL